MPLVFVKSQKNQDQLLHDGYVYSMNVRKSDKCNWRCVEYHRRKCTARVHTKGDQVVFETTRNHNHHPATAATAGELYVNSRRSRQRQATTAKSTSTDKKKPTDDLTVSSIVQSIVREVTSAVDDKGGGDRDVSATPALKADAFLLHETLSDTQISDERILLFGTHRNLDLMEKKSNDDRCCWFVDSSFGGSPPLFHRILVLHAILDTGAVVPTIYCLLPNDRRETYIRALCAVRNARSNDSRLRVPGGIMMDLTDDAQVDAFQLAFDEDVSDIRCCFRHLTRSLWRIIDLNVKLRIEYDSDPSFALNVRKLAALAFVPADRVVKIFDDLMRSPFYVTNDTILAPLIDHFEDTWIGRPTRSGTRRSPRHPLAAWNCHEEVIERDMAETLVAIEVWHRSFSSIVFASRGHTVSKFIDRLQSEQSDYEAVIRLRSGAVGSGGGDRQGHGVTAARLTEIVSAFGEFESVDEFLTAAAQCFHLHYNCCLI